MTKLCSKCGVVKDEEDFAKSKKKDGRQVWCRSCRKKYDRARYYARDGVEKERQTVKNRRISQRNRDYVWQYRSTHPCVDCGEDDPVVLQFDHVRGEKRFALALACGHRYSLETIQEEIEKCEIRCANCHLKRHYPRLAQSG